MMFPKHPPLEAAANSASLSTSRRQFILNAFAAGEVASLPMAVLRKRNLNPKTEPTRKEINP